MSVHVSTQYILVIVIITVTIMTATDGYEVAEQSD